MPALFRRKIQGTEKGKRSGGKPLSGLIKVLTYRQRGKGMPYLERVTKAGMTIEVERYYSSRYRRKGLERGDRVRARFSPHARG